MRLTANSDSHHIVQPFRAYRLQNNIDKAWERKQAENVKVAFLR